MTTNSILKRTTQTAQGMSTDGPELRKKALVMDCPTWSNTPPVMPHPSSQEHQKWKSPPPHLAPPQVSPHCKIAKPSVSTRRPPPPPPPPPIKGNSLPSSSHKTANRIPPPPPPQPPNVVSCLHDKQRLNKDKPLPPPLLPPRRFVPPPPPSTLPKPINQSTNTMIPQLDRSANIPPPPPRRTSLKPQHQQMDRANPPPPPPPPLLKHPSLARQMSLQTPRGTSQDSKLPRSSYRTGHVTLVEPPQVSSTSLTQQPRQSSVQSTVVPRQQPPPPPLPPLPPPPLPNEVLEKRHNSQIPTSVARRLSAENVGIGKRSDFYNSQSLSDCRVQSKSTINQETASKSNDETKRSPENDANRRGKNILTHDVGSSIKMASNHTSTGRDLYVPLIRAMSYLLLGLPWKSQLSSSPEQRPDKLEILAGHVDKFSLASAPVGWFSFSTGKQEVNKIIERHASRLELQNQGAFSLPSKSLVSVKRRFKRKRRRKVPRRTILSQLDRLDDRDLDDDEFARLVHDLLKSPLRVEEYEEIVELEDKVEPYTAPFALLPISASLGWKALSTQRLSFLTHGERKEEALTDYEEQLLLESTDEWLRSTDTNDDYSDDDLTEMDLWILDDGCIQGNELAVNTEISNQYSAAASRRMANAENAIANNQYRRQPNAAGLSKGETGTRNTTTGTSGAYGLRRRAETPTRRHGTHDMGSTKSPIGFGLLSWPWKSRAPEAPESKHSIKESSNPDSIGQPRVDPKRMSRLSGMMLGESASDSMSPSISKKSASAVHSGRHNLPEGFRYVRED